MTPFNNELICETVKTVSGEKSFCSMSMILYNPINLFNQNSDIKKDERSCNFIC